MQFSGELIEAKLIKRYKRFLADIIFENGYSTTVYCPNPGSLIGLAEKNTKIWLEKSKNKNAKYQYKWKLTELYDGTLVCIDTQMANMIINENIKLGKIPEFCQYDTIISEPKIDSGSRLDFLLKSEGGVPCYIEVKSSTLSRFPNLSEFPDSVTSRGSKHLSILKGLKLKGFRAIQIYLIQRNDTNTFKIARDIDYLYFKSFQMAKSSGIEILVLQSFISKTEIKLSEKRPTIL